MKVLFNGKQFNVSQSASLPVKHVAQRKGHNDTVVTRPSRQTGFWNGSLRSTSSSGRLVSSSLAVSPVAVALVLLLCRLAPFS